MHALVVRGAVDLAAAGGGHADRSIDLVETLQTAGTVPEFVGNVTYRIATICYNIC